MVLAALRRAPHCQGVSSVTVERLDEIRFEHTWGVSYIGGEVEPLACEGALKEIFIAALGLGWGAVSSLDVLKSSSVSSGRQPTAVDQETPSGGPSLRQVYTPAAGDVGRNTSPCLP
jgi:hypothetical protein